MNCSCTVWIDSFSSTTVRPVGIALSFPSRVWVGPSVARPRWRHGGSGSVALVVDERQIFLLRDGGSQLPQDVVVDMTGLAASFEKCLGVRVTAGRVLLRQQVGAHRKKNGVRVRVWIHVRLCEKPVVDSKRDLESFNSILGNLGESACLVHREEKRKGQRSVKNVLAF